MRVNVNAVWRLWFFTFVLFIICVSFTYSLCRHVAPLSSSVFFGSFPSQSLSLYRPLPPISYPSSFSLSLYLCRCFSSLEVTKYSAINGYNKTSDVPWHNIAICCKRSDKYPKLFNLNGLCCGSDI